MNPSEKLKSSSVTSFNSSYYIDSSNDDQIVDDVLYDIGDDDPLKTDQAL